MNILADSRLPGLTTLFSHHFTLTTYDSQEQIPALIPQHDILLCRSTLKVTPKLLANTPVQCVATASSGVDHIDAAYLTNEGIQLFDAKGCNARAVADYVVSMLAVLHQKKLLLGDKAGVVGVGAVGSQVVERLKAAGMEVVYFDPLRAMQDNSFVCCSLSDLFECDLICIHANLHETLPFSSKNLFNADILKKLKPGVAVINASRGGIVNEEALLNNLETITYCTDVYAYEPMIGKQIVDFATICTPHIAGHSLDAKYAAVVKLSKQLHRFYGFEMPAVQLPDRGKKISLSQSNWQNAVLGIYDPTNETKILKNAQNITKAFLETRQAHQFRRDFINYDVRLLNQEIKLILGY